MVPKGTEESRTYCISLTRSCQNFSAQAEKYKKMPDRAKKTEGGGPPALSKEKERRAVFFGPFQPMFLLPERHITGFCLSVSGIFCIKKPLFLGF